MKRRKGQDRREGEGVKKHKHKYNYMLPGVP